MKTSKILLALTFMACIGPAIISYKPYVFLWDDAGYLEQSVQMSKAVWSGNPHAVSRAIQRDVRPPMMMFMGLPWGPANSWTGASRYFFTLTSLNLAAAAFCLFLLLRIGTHPGLLVLAGLCILASYLPPSSAIYYVGTGFYADMLISWIALATLLLIPYEAVSESSDLSTGLLWGLVFGAGALSKASLLCFIGLSACILIAIRYRRRGARAVLVSLAACTVVSIPAIGYWLRYGLPALRNGWAASFGNDAPIYGGPLSGWISFTAADSPGLFPAFIVCLAGLYFLVRRRRGTSFSRIAPLLILACYLALAFLSANRQNRYFFPGFIGLPILVAVALSRNEPQWGWKPAGMTAISSFVCLALLAAPVAFRADARSIERSQFVTNQAKRAGARRVVLGTDSRNFNAPLLMLSDAIAGYDCSVETLAFSATRNVPIANDFESMSTADLVVIEEHPDPIGIPSWWNNRSPQYSEWLRQRMTNVVKFSDLTIYIRDIGSAATP